jgi:hypothetical protein
VHLTSIVRLKLRVQLTGCIASALDAAFISLLTVCRVIGMMGEAKTMLLAELVSTGRYPCLQEPAAALHCHCGC